VVRRFFWDSYKVGNMGIYQDGGVQMSSGLSSREQGGDGCRKLVGQGCMPHAYVYKSRLGSAPNSAPCPGHQIIPASVRLE